MTPSFAEFMLVILGTFTLIWGLTALMVYFDLKEVRKERKKERELAKSVEDWNALESEMNHLEKQAVFFINMKEIEKEFKEV